MGTYLGMAEQYSTLDKESSLGCLETIMFGLVRRCKTVNSHRSACLLEEENNSQPSNERKQITNANQQ